MKLKLNLVLLSIIVITIFVSCQKGDVYSCDPIADMWVKQNLSLTQSMSRDGWLKLDKSETVKKAVYVSFHSDIKRAFWINKISEVMNQFSWTAKEIAHFSLILDYAKTTNIFHKKGTDDNFELFTYKWIEYATNELKWSKKLIYGIFASGETLQNKQGTIISSSKIIVSSTRSNDPITPPDPSGNCTCSMTSDYCDIFGEIPDNVVSCNRNNTDCVVTVRGCGFFLSFDCDGMCTTPMKY